jgi:3-methyl-2-oxobutanoate hydroxymethyltransferase
MSSDRRQEVERRKLTAYDVRQRKGGEKLSMIALYDYPFARLAESAGVDLLLVGDSLGMVVQGHDSTLPVTLDDVVYHTRAVRRGAPRTHVVADMPFLTYQIDTTRAIESAGRLLQAGGADSVKLEGGQAVAEPVAAIVAAGIPVMGHVGLTPQSAGSLGGYRVQGRDTDSARRILADAQAVAGAGAFAIVLEAIPAELAELITERVPVPTIGIGAGVSCDGQVLVAHDLLGLQDELHPRFVKEYAPLGQLARHAFAQFAADVKRGAFPGTEHAYAMPEGVLAPLASSEEGP